MASNKQKLTTKFINGIKAQIVDYCVSCNWQSYQIGRDSSKRFSRWR